MHLRQDTPDGLLRSHLAARFEDATTMLFSRSHLPASSWVKGRLPLKLLHGPWTDDKIQFLRFLLWTTSMTVDWTNPVMRQAVLDGKKEAILEKNLEAVQLLNHNRRLGKAPSLDLIRFAVLEGGCERSIVYDLMDTARTWGLTGDGWNDDVLDKWCEEQAAAGNPKGSWLQRKLTELRTTTEAAAEEGSNEQKVSYGRLDPKEGDYEDVEGDKLVVTPLKWNQVSYDFQYFLEHPGHAFQRILNAWPGLAIVERQLESSMTRVLGKSIAECLEDWTTGT